MNWLVQVNMEMKLLPTGYNGLVCSSLKLLNSVQEDSHLFTFHTEYVICFRDKVYEDKQVPS